MFTPEQSIADWDWNELRAVLAVARTGSLSAAARQLNASHPTIYRRILQLEKRLGAELFDKSATGYVPTQIGDMVVNAVERMASEVDSLEAQLNSGPSQLSGTLRLTSSDTFYSYVLVPILARFRRLHPSVTVDVVATNEFVNLHHQDIDVAFRSSRRSPQNLYGVKLSDLLLGVHAHQSHPVVSEDPVRLANHDWIGFDEGMTLTMLSAFMREYDLERKVVFRVNSLIYACDAVRQNVGLSILPLYVGKTVEEIVSLNEDDWTLRSELWMLSTRAQQRKPLVRTFCEFMESEQAEISELLAGSTG